MAAELNIPYYPLLRRNVDCIIALDASADSQVSHRASPLRFPPQLLRGLAGLVVHTRRRWWLECHIHISSLTQDLDDIELAAKRGLRTWPRGAGWPAKVASAADTPARDRGKQNAPQADPEAATASRKLAATQETALAEQAGRQGHSVRENGPAAQPQRTYYVIERDLRMSDIYTRFYQSPVRTPLRARPWASLAKCG